MRHFTPAQLQAYLESLSESNLEATRESNSPLLLDVREPWEYEKCHLANSSLVPMRQIPEHAPQMQQDQEIVVICHHGIRSRQVAQYLESVGFTDLINLTGGVESWAIDIDPTMKRY